MAVLPWGLVEAGILTGKFLEREANPTRLKPDKPEQSEKAVKVIQELMQVAGEGGRSISQATIN